MNHIAILLIACAGSFIWGAYSVRAGVKLLPAVICGGLIGFLAETIPYLF